MKKILITGGTGFIGKQIIRKCIESGVDYLSCGVDVVNENEHERFCDITDIESIKKVIADYVPDSIIHLAAIAAPVHKNIAQIYSVNVVGTENMLSAAAELLPPTTRFILISTAGVYGNQDIKQYNEELNFNPVNHYSYSKMITEIISRQYKDRLNITIVRPFNVIGLGQVTNFLVPKLVKAFTEKQPELFLGNTKAVRDFIPCELCAETMLKLCLCEENAPDILNICSGVGHTCEDVINLLAEITGHHPKVTSSSEFIRTNEIWRMVGDPTRLSSFLGYDVSKDYLKDVLISMIQ